VVPNGRTVRCDSVQVTRSTTFDRWSVAARQMIDAGRTSCRPRCGVLDGDESESGPAISFLPATASPWLSSLCITHMHRLHSALIRSRTRAYRLRLAVLATFGAPHPANLQRAGEAIMPVSADAAVGDGSATVRSIAFDGCLCWLCKDVAA